MSTAAEEIKEKPSWTPLESNPEAFNQYITKLKVGGVECTEIFGFDDDLLKFVPGPHYALIFCYPCSDKAGDYLKQIYSDLEGSKGDKVPEGIFFMKQKIRNACGTFSLLHSLTNNVQRLEIGDGPFASWFSEALPLGVQERSQCLANNAAMATAHQNCAEIGETEAPQADKVEYHFIAYFNHKGRLVECDSAQNIPRDCGPTSDETLLADAGKQCKKLMSILENISCNAIALVKKQA